jgi:hypothetical protein
MEHDQNMDRTIRETAKTMLAALAGTCPGLRYRCPFGTMQHDQNMDRTIRETAESMIDESASHDAHT